MPTLAHLYTQNTARWGYDNSEFVATVKVVRGKLLRRDDDIDECTQRMHHIKLPVALKGIQKGKLWNMLDDVYTMRCHCEYDCCGHFTGGVRQVRIKGRHVSFMTSYSRNY